MAKGRLYLETNYLLSRATGRTHNAREIFISRPAHIDIAIPSHAITEAKIALKSIANAKRNLVSPFDAQISDIGRDKAPHAKSVAAALSDAATNMALYIQDCETRLSEALSDVLANARIFEASARTIVYGAAIIDDPLDDLMLGFVLEDAKLNALTNMAFLSEDGGFTRPTVRDELQNVNVSPFKNVDEVLGWFHAIPS